MTTAPCPICGSATTTSDRETSLGRELRSDDLKITDARYGLTLPLRRCAECGFLFADLDGVSDLAELYEQLDDDTYDEGAGARERQMYRLLAWAIAHQRTAATLLDVGAASGLLVGEASKLGLDAVGVEPSASLAATATQRGRTVYRGVLPHADLEGRQFDLVTLVDVIEHVEDPTGLLSAAADRVVSGGLMLVVTPDVDSVAARLLGRRWWHFRLAHVGYFDRDTLTRALRSVGAEPVAWRRPSWYFPVSYLLERVGAYLPIGRLVERLSAYRLVRRLLGLEIPLNLRDSHAVLARVDT